MSGYLYDFENEANIYSNDRGQSLGISTKIASDIYASFQSPAFRITNNDSNWMIVNPHLFGEASIWSSVTVKLIILEVTLTFKLIGFKFSPLDFQVAFDLDSTNRYCSSVGFFQDVFDIRLDISSAAYECHNGIIGTLREGGDSSDCVWRTYQPQLPLWETTLYDKGDSTTDYVAWKCTDDS